MSKYSKEFIIKTCEEYLSCNSSKLELCNKYGIHYKNVYGTHIIGPLLIRNPYFTDYLLDKICKEHKLKFNKADSTAKKAYKKYLENFLN